MDDEKQAKQFCYVIVATGIIIILIGVVCKFSKIDEWFAIFVSIGSSIIAASIVDVLYGYFYNNKFKRDLAKQIGSLFKSTNEWGLQCIVPALWKNFFTIIESSSKIQYLAFNGISIFSDDPNRRKSIMKFFNNGGILDLIIQKPDCPAFKERQKDWKNDNIEELFKLEFITSLMNFRNTLEDLKAQKPMKKYKITVFHTEKFLYGSLVVFDSTLYHYTPSSYAWKHYSGFSIHAYNNSKLSELFDKVFERAKSEPYLEINPKNIEKKIDELSNTINRLRNESGILA